MTTDADMPVIVLDDPQPAAWRWTLGFIVVGIAWGFTTPFIRRAAVHYKPSEHASADDPERSWLARKIARAFWTVVDLLRSPSYAIPLLVNVTGSIWFFLLIGQAELSLTVPIVNSLAFLFTVLGEWWAEGRIISKDTWLGMALVLGGIGLCVYSKS